MLTAARTWFNQIHINTQLMILITLLNIIDFQTTKIIVDVQGFYAEVNPLLFYILVLTNTIWGIALVKFVTLGLWWGIYNRVSKNKVITEIKMTRILTTIAIIFSGVVIWNFSVIAFDIL